MTDHAIQKPIVFVSHASSDADFANAIKQEIEKVFANGVNVYCTSSPGTIPVGTDWLLGIEKNLEISKAIIAVVTPVSIERPWLWFELGATWLKGRSGDCKIYPLCTAEIDLSTLPSPLDRLQALSMGRAADLKLLFEALIAQFGFGQISSFKATNIIKRIPKYKDVEVKEVDLREQAFYSGRYTGYNDSELQEIIDSKLFRPDYDETNSSRGTYLNREDVIHKGQLLHFRDVDKRLELPPGTAKRLLNSVAARYYLTPTLEEKNIVRYGKDSVNEDEIDEDESDDVA